MELQTQFEHALKASRSLNCVSQAVIDATLVALADTTENNKERILKANQEDLARMDPKNPMYDRLLLNAERITAIAADIRKVAALPSPVGEVLRAWSLPNGLKIRKVSVPFGVIGVIYEARPNVGFDVFSLCLKTMNACILKGGSDARCSNEVIVEILREVLRAQGLDEHCVTLLPTDHAATAEMLHAVGYVDLVIPRGSRRLIDFVRENARIPIIETGAGVCHTYFDKEANLSQGIRIIENGKTRRVSVCNALDCLIIHRDRLHDLPAIGVPLAEKGVVLYADKEAYAALQGYYPEALLQHATPEHFGMEFQDYKMAVRTVSSLTEAIDHIAHYSSKHSEAIVSENPQTIQAFQQQVDAACVYANSPTSFTDGGQFGFGAEIGISTQKLHARGPMALPELTTYKYLIDGEGQVRP
ncbi:MAG: glutamate-5-semialdehyde dehydrogenase [Alistipes sp.]|nr:glutamate-5-semialdehyde dehydrogenase [Alistipes sp.]